LTSPRARSSPRPTAVSRPRWRCTSRNWPRLRCGGGGCAKSTIVCARCGRSRLRMRRSSNDHAATDRRQPPERRDEHRSANGRGKARSSGQRPTARPDLRSRTRTPSCPGFGSSWRMRRPSRVSSSRIPIGRAALELARAEAHLQRVRRDRGAVASRP
jgi:hypothetical protein